MVHVTLLTGASRGIGASIAEIILSSSNDTKLVAVARSATQLDALAAKFGPDRVATVVGDVTDLRVLAAAVSTAISKFGKLDAVIANAGILDPVGPIKDAKIEEWKRLYDINVFSVVDLVTKAIPELRKSGGGRIIAVLSGASTTSYDGWSAYGSSKAALNHVFQSIAEEEKEFGIRSISVAPGVVDTSMQSDIRNVFSKNMKAEAAQRFTDLHKDGKLLPPQVPGHVYARLALDGWSDELNGKYLRYNDEKLSSYQL